MAHGKLAIRPQSDRNKMYIKKLAATIPPTTWDAAMATTTSFPPSPPANSNIKRTAKGNATNHRHNKDTNVAKRKRPCALSIDSTWRSICVATMNPISLLIIYNGIKSPTTKRRDPTKSDKMHPNHIHLDAQ
eukprot:CAMPEP_0118680858 /NCGR_PEP_ID=MMETSP0800-20121206/4607_1 /TAXON_ID=210618 ORGANISM="Striatella unipunctata, Strain CCMP2910" /NCGR_SAMPLE_ID=MMETSP0800 /ASSEMBLY_ACC=CAM_ASM_000638 /LENGTH=131 /DNA_ID=CAMNT_0006577071 /DNA_START=95 /DNA_END=490 /DNA_ORIENTATION=+